MRRGFTLVELLVAIMVSSIILLAVASLFMGSNRAFRVNRDVAEMSEDVRNAITTLEFIFSRWGAGVPCANNNCNITNNIQPCNNQYPPQDPMCMDISGGRVIFYANLYGIGFVNNIDANNISLVSCRLNTSSNQNCYYVWSSGRVILDNNQPKIVSLNGNVNQDCISGVNAVSISRTTNPDLLQGNYITRVPHRITLYVQGEWLMMDREDMAQACNDTETAIRIGRVQNFSVQTQGRSVVVNATFVSADGRTYPITRVYGR